MADTYHKKLLVHNIATMTAGDFLLGDFTPYYVVGLTFEATGLNAADGVVSFIQRANSSSTWKVPTGLSSTMSTSPYSDELVNGDYSGGDVGVRIAHGSCTTGTITVYVTAKCD